jgi:TetR/AcrR family transcriptional repressor of nem operon
MTPADPDAAPHTDARERLLEAGTELLRTKGFHACGLTEILTHAGVPKGSFYHYFASKEEFGVVLIERARDQYLNELRELLGDRRRSPIERLRAVFQHSRDHCALDGPTVECLIPKLALECATLSDPVQAAVKTAYAMFGAMLAQVVREAQSAKQVEASLDADHLASVLVMLWEGAAIRMQIERSVAPLDDFLTSVFEQVLRPARGTDGSQAQA